MNMKGMPRRGMPIAIPMVSSVDNVSGGGFTGSGGGFFHPSDPRVVIAVLHISFKNLTCVSM